MGATAVPTTAGGKLPQQSCRDDVAKRQNGPEQASPAGWTRHEESLVVAGPAFPFCACFASRGWARLSGAARFSATEPVTGGDQTSVDAPPEGTRRGVSSCSAVRLGCSGGSSWFSRMASCGTSRRTGPRTSGAQAPVRTASWRRTRPHTLRGSVSYEPAGLMGVIKPDAAVLARRTHRSGRKRNYCQVRPRRGDR
jgi:hypothetical protein